MENKWIGTIEAQRATIRAQDEFSEALLADNARLKEDLKKYERVIARLTAKGWPEREGL